MQSTDFEQHCVTPGLYFPFHASFESACVQSSPKVMVTRGVEFRKGSEDAQDAAKWFRKRR